MFRADSIIGLQPLRVYKWDELHEATIESVNGDDERLATTRDPNARRGIMKEVFDNAGISAQGLKLANEAAGISVLAFDLASKAGEQEAAVVTEGSGGHGGGNAGEGEGIEEIDDSFGGDAAGASAGMGGLQNEDAVGGSSDGLADDKNDQEGTMVEDGLGDEAGSEGGGAGREDAEMGGMQEEDAASGSGDGLEDGGSEQSGNNADPIKGSDPLDLMEIGEDGVWRWKEDMDFETDFVGDDSDIEVSDDVDPTGLTEKDENGIWRWKDDSAIEDFVEAAERDGEEGDQDDDVIMDESDWLRQWTEGGPV